MKSLRGTLTALVTPFRDGAVDVAALEALVESQIQAGVDGLVPCGTTGEAPTLDRDEFKLVVTTVVRTARGRVSVIAGSGSNSTAQSLELIRLNESCGVDGLLIVAPYYNKPPQEGLFQHFSAAAQATALPIVLYNIPGRCGVEVSVETICRLRAAHPNIAAVKHATGSIAGAMDLRAACDIDLLSGDDPLTYSLMSLGAIGVISVLSNLMPAETKALTAAALAGDWARARALHESLYPVSKALLSLDINPIPIKTALHLRGICSDEFRLPLVRLNPAKTETLCQLLAQPALRANA